MKKRLFIYSTLIIFTGFLCFFAASVYVTYTNNLIIAEDTVIEITKICANLYKENADFYSFVKSEGEVRITIISRDGVVLADSRQLDVETLQNHLSRPEIQAAASGSPATHKRYSESLGVDFIYYALKAECGDEYVFIRTAVPVAKINAYMLRVLPPLVFLFVLIALFCLLFICKIINRIVMLFNSVKQKLKFLSTDKYKAESDTKSDSTTGYEEIDEIIREIDEIALVLQNNIYTLHDEKNKLNYILNNIGDGLFAVDEDKSIVLINAAALNIFNVNPDILGKNLNYLTYDKIIAGAVDDCANQEKDVLCELILNGRIFFTAVKRLPDKKLIMIVLSDVTDNRENAKRREEFFANASHELKTPLTAIKGFNELTAMNNKDENVNKYINSITRETNRMLTLIGDMLKLSELENTQDIKPITVSLSKVVNEVHEVLSASINEKDITFETVGDAMVTTEQGHIYELIKNLIENAIRYNNQKGKISVTIENEKQTSKLVISDNGIGISTEEQTRIFERFYRVEKSRSGRNGGTGLGLSIVKHICSLYDWKLSLKSRLGIGTEVVVIFINK